MGQAGIIRTADKGEHPPGLPVLDSLANRILIIDYDLFNNVGGGQTVYQNIIRKRPQDQFYYFIYKEAPDAPRPANAHPIPYRVVYRRQDADLPRESRHFYDVYIETENMAASVALALGRTGFDVVDTPDYRQCGLFIRHSLKRHGIDTGVVALALHGTLSSAFVDGWPTGTDESRVMAEMRLREHLQFRAVDTRYAISRSYSDHWRAFANLPVNHLDPLCVIHEAKPRSAIFDNRPPDLAFVGRRERRKGPDLFVDLAWWLPPGSFRKALIVGPDGFNRLGQGSEAILRRAAALRGLSAEIIASSTQAEFSELFHRRTVVLLPSRYDQFNLIALEALVVGCPVVVSRHAGVARYLRDELSHLDSAIIGIECSREGAATVRAVLEDYDGHRARIVERLLQHPVAANTGTLERIYEFRGEIDLQAQTTTRDLAVRFDMFNAPGRGSMLDAAVLENRLQLRVARRTWDARLLASFGRPAAHLRDMARLLRRGPRRWLARAHLKDLIPRLTGISARSLAQYYFIGRLACVRRNLLCQGERATAELEAKLKTLSRLAQRQSVDRVRHFREMIRLERKHGRNDLIAATYCLRIMRWLGHDAYSDLPFVVTTLRRHGYDREAEVAEAMFADPAIATQRCRALLDRQLERQRSKPDLPLEIRDDRRPPGRFRVAVIVSLYKAEGKLRTFFDMLRQQTLLRTGAVEIILVDSGSPTNEYGVFREMMAENPLPALYARSHERETIQAAWNRGIKLASADYLAFLGVDEGIHPSCLAILAKELDVEPDVDWVIANSLVTSVDRAGVFESDIMPYDRKGYRHDWNYLDTTFMSYVGGLYRRSIHERFGYYDETFTAAGDTEFKTRILPFIKSKWVPMTLGVFNNYPEERTTQHPRAEIEDLRAWYLHRTVAGMAYAFDNAPTDRAVMLLRDTLRYRKCFCYHWSTDLDLADSLAKYLAGRPDAGKWAAAEREIGQVMALYRELELVDITRSSTRLRARLLRQALQARRLARQHREQFELEARPAYQFFNDNRYEQHWWSWSG